MSASMGLNSTAPISPRPLEDAAAHWVELKTNSRQGRHFGWASREPQRLATGPFPSNSSPSLATLSSRLETEPSGQ